MPVDMENTTYFLGAMVEKRHAIYLSINKVFLPCSKENLKRLSRDTENVVRCAKFFENCGNWFPNNSQFIRGM